MKTSYYLKKFIKSRISYAASIVLDDVPDDTVYEIPNHLPISSMSKFRFEHVSGNEVLLGYVEQKIKDWTIVDGQWHEIALAKDRNILKIWKDLHA